MIFIHTWEKVLSGEKTQTRRLSTHHAGSFYDGHWGAVYNTVTGMPVWVVGKDYAVQPGRTKPAVARIRIVEIRQEDVREISYEDVCAEGFKNESEFLYLWCDMHDKEGYRQYFKQHVYPQRPAQFLKQRPSKFYNAWALTFQLVTAD